MTKEEINIFTRRITQSSQSELVVITYEIISTYVNDAIDAYDAGDEENFIFNVKKAKQFLNNLSSALDFSYKISLELMNIYMYVERCFIESIVKNKPARLDVVLDIMQKLKSSFEEVSRQDNSGASMRGGEQVYAGLTYGRGVLNEVAMRSNAYN